MSDNINNKLWSSKQAKEIPSSLSPDSTFFSKLKAKSIVLDIGCGVGALAIQLAQEGHNLYGIDLSNDAIVQAKENAVQFGVDSVCDFTSGSAAKLPYTDNTFDSIIIQAVLTTVVDASERLEILKEAKRVLKKDGFLYLAEFAQTWQREDYRKRYIENIPVTGEEGLFVVYDLEKTEIYRAKHFSQKEMVNLLIEAGFTISLFKTKDFTTRSGNVIDGIQSIALK